MGIFNDGWEDEVYRLKARIKELEKENENLRANLTQVSMQRDTFAMKLAIYGISPKPWDNKEVE
jgi:prefoldin subunit 5